VKTLSLSTTHYPTSEVEKRGKGGRGENWKTNPLLLSLSSLQRKGGDREKGGGEKVSSLLIFLFSQKGKKGGSWEKEGGEGGGSLTISSFLSPHWLRGREKEENSTKRKERKGGGGVPHHELHHQGREGKPSRTSSSSPSLLGKRGKVEVGGGSPLSSFPKMG